MSVAEDRRRAFVDTYNAVIGVKHGRPMPFYNDAQIANMVSPAMKEKAAIMLAKKIKPPTVKKAASTTSSATAAQLMTILGKGTHGGGPTGKIKISDLPGTPKKSESGIGGVFKDIGGGIADVAGYLGIGHEKNESPEEAAAGLTVTDFLKEVNSGKSTQKALEVINHGVDLFERPKYALAELSRQMALNPGDPSKWGSGAWQGFQGKEKTGWGDVYEAAIPDNAITRSTGLNNIWTKRAVGLAGDVFLDPATYASGGSEIIGKTALTGGIQKTLTEGLELGAKPTLRKLLLDSVQEHALGGGKGLNTAATRAELRTGTDALKEQAYLMTKQAIKRAKLKDVPRFRKGNVKTPASLSDHIYNHVSDKIDNMIYDMRNGGMIGGGSADRATIAHTISEGVRDSMVDDVARAKDKFLGRLRTGGTWSDAERAKMRTDNPAFGEWMDIAEEVQRTTKKLDREGVAKAADIKWRETLEPTIKDIRGMVRDNLDDAFMKVPYAKFMNKKVYFPTAGKVLAKGAKFADENAYIASINKAFRYSSWFPGYSSHIAQKLKSMNVQEYDAFKKQVDDLFVGTTMAQRQNIHHALEEGIELPGRDGDIQKQLRKWYDGMHESEVGAGVRSPNTAKSKTYAKNYVYNYIDTGRLHPRFDQDWALAKKAQVRAHGDMKGFTSADARLKKMKAIDDAGQAILLRKAKNIRKLSRVNFGKDLATHYGIRSRISPRLAESQNLKIVDARRYKELYDKLKIDVGGGERLYLDRDIAKIYDNYNDLVKYLSKPTTNGFLKNFEDATKAWKTMNTIYWPGFHLRNMVGDVFMGAMDGVKSHRYGQIANAMIHKDSSLLKLGGEKVPFRQIYKSYVDNAATAGFFDSEMKRSIDPKELATWQFMDQSLRGTAKRVNAKLRGLSEGREDFGRLVHYYHALDDEMNFQLKKGLPRETALKNAEEAALERVNKYKFDYNALTPTELTIRKFGIPFYTYMRKATPVLLESLMLHPQQFIRLYNLQRSLAPSDDFRGMSVPQKLQDMAYSELSSGENHVGFTDELFPSRTLADVWSNPVKRLNPAWQGMFELESGKDVFSNKPVGNFPGGIWDILKNKSKAVSTYRSLDSNYSAGLDKIAGLFGIPIKTINAAKEVQRLSELEQLVTDKSKALNAALDEKGLRVEVRGDKVYLYKPKSPTEDEIRHNLPPRYPVNPKKQVLKVYDSFNDLPFKF